MAIIQKIIIIIVLIFNNIIKMWIYIYTICIKNKIYIILFIENFIILYIKYIFIKLQFNFLFNEDIQILSIFFVTIIHMI